MKTYIRQLLMLTGLTMCGFLIFVLLFWIGLCASITILFYRGLLIAVLASLLVGAGAYWIARRSNDPSLPIAAASLTLSFNICFLVLLPVTVDRSVTVFLLSTIQRQQNRGIDAPALQQAFIEGYVIRMGAIDRRIEEQRKSGNLTIAPDGKVRLTDQGRHFMTLSRIIARLFGTDPRFVDGQPAVPEPRSTAVEPSASKKQG